MIHHNHDPQRDVGQTHAPPEDALMDRHAFDAAPAGEARAGQSRRPPALTLQANPAQQARPEQGRREDWRTLRQDSGQAQRQDPEAQAEPYATAKAYRSRMLEKVGNDPERGINFTDEELQGFIAHAEGLGFGQSDVEAILAVKVRKPSVKVDILKSVAECLSQKRTETRIKFKDGWDFMRAYRVAQLAMLSGQTLMPEVYLSDDYLEEHQKTFSGKASYLLPGDRFNDFVNPETTDKERLGYNGALYVSSAAEIDRVLVTAQGDIAKVEQMLGINPGKWQGQHGIWRVDILAPESKGLRIPNGFEASANEFWTPGAITSGGTMEAVLDEVQRTEENHSFKQVIR